MVARLQQQASEDGGGGLQTTRPNFIVAVLLKYRSNAHDGVEGTYADDDPGPSACPPFAMARVAMTGTAAADPVADGAGAQAPATVVPPGMRSGRWNSSDRVQLEDAVMVARIAGASQVRLIRPGYATIEIDLKHEKAAGDRESVQAAERSCDHHRVLQLRAIVAIPGSAAHPRRHDGGRRLRTSPVRHRVRGRGPSLS